MSRNLAVWEVRAYVCFQTQSPRNSGVYIWTNNIVLSYYLCFWVNNELTFRRIHWQRRTMVQPRTCMSPSLSPTTPKNYTSPRISIHRRTAESKQSQLAAARQKCGESKETGAKWCGGSVALTPALAGKLCALALVYALRLMGQIHARCRRFCWTQAESLCEESQSRLEVGKGLHT